LSFIATLTHALAGVSPTFFGQDIIPGVNHNSQAGPSRLNMVPSNTAPALKIRSKDYVSSAKTRVKRKPKESVRSPQSDSSLDLFYPDLSKHSLSEGGTKGKRKSDNKLSGMVSSCHFIRANQAL
jgi:hypothetical protein